MDDRQIAAMKEYDWTWFCSQRIYQNRVQALPSEQCEDESEQSCLFRKFESLSCTWDTGDVDSRRFGWLSSLEDELLYRRLCKLPEDDLELLCEALLNMFENDRSAARGKMAVRELIIFKHDSELGNAPAYRLFESVHVVRKAGVDVPRAYADYIVSVDDTPDGVTCIRRA